MWSKRRKKFARKYDHFEHRRYLMQRELWRRYFAGKLKFAILYGFTAVTPTAGSSQGIKIANDIIRKCF